MRNILLSGVFAIAGTLLNFGAPLMGAITAQPGMLNYVEGQARVDGVTVTSKSVGSVDVAQGQSVETGNGKAEILLTPGVFMRLGSNSAVRMVNPGLADTSVELLQGEAMVEATFIQKANNIQVLNQGTTTTLDKNGLYGFRSEAPQIQVYDGKATVQQGDKREELKKGKQLFLADFKKQSFDTKQGDELYRWSDLRSAYLSEASVASSRLLVVNNYGWGGGWYWNPGFGFYSYLPGDGFLASPFGWGYYSPYYVRYYGGPYRYRGPYVTTGRGFAVPQATNRSFSAGPAPRASFAQPAVRSAAPSGMGGVRGGRR
jgi:FecR protein